MRWKNEEDFIWEMKTFQKAVQSIENKYKEAETPPEKRKPYTEVEFVINFREETGITQQQIADVLGMTKQGWSKKEKSCRQWIEAGRPEQESYRDDVRFTAEEWLRIYRLAEGTSSKYAINGWAWMEQLLKEAVKIDAVLTKEVLQSIGKAKPPALQRIQKTVVPLIQSEGAEHFLEADVVCDLRRQMIDAIDRVMVNQIVDDDGLSGLWAAAQREAQFELKRKAYRKELEEAIVAAQNTDSKKVLFIACTKEALRKDMGLRTEVQKLLDARPMPEVREKEREAEELQCFEDLMVRKIEMELRKCTRAVVVQLKQKTMPKTRESIDEYVEQNIFKQDNFRSTKSET